MNFSHRSRLKFSVLLTKMVVPLKAVELIFGLQVTIKLLRAFNDSKTCILLVMWFENLLF